MNPVFVDFARRNPNRGGVDTAPHAGVFDLALVNGVWICPSVAVGAHLDAHNHGPGGFATPLDDASHSLQPEAVHLCQLRKLVDKVYPRRRVGVSVRSIRPTVGCELLGLVLDGRWVCPHPVTFWHLGLHLAPREIGVGVIVACTTKIKRVVAFSVKPLGYIGVARPFAEVLWELAWVSCPIRPVVCSVRMVVSARDPLVAWPLPLRHDERRK